MNRLFDLYLDNIAEAKKLAEVLYPVISSFNGKVYNARFKNKMDEVLLNHFHNDSCKTVYTEVTIDNSHVYIALCFWNNRSCQSENGEGWVYLPSGYEKITLINKYTKYGEKQIDLIKYDDNFNIRLEADKIVSEIKENIEKLQERREMLKAEQNNVDIYRQKKEAIVKELEKLNEEIPMEIKDFFEIKTYVSQWW